MAKRMGKVKGKLARRRTAAHTIIMCIIAVIIANGLIISYGGGIACKLQPYVSLAYIFVPLFVIALAFATWLFIARYVNDYNRIGMGYTVLVPVIIYYIALFLMVSTVAAACPLIP